MADTPTTEIADTVTGGLRGTTTVHKAASFTSLAGIAVLMFMQFAGPIQAKIENIEKKLDAAQATTSAMAVTAAEAKGQTAVLTEKVASLKEAFDRAERDRDRYPVVAPGR